MCFLVQQTTLVHNVNVIKLGLCQSTSIACQSRTLTLSVNRLKTKLRLLYLKIQSVPCSKHFHLGYKNQSLYVIWGKSRFLFWDKYKTCKYSVAECKIIEC
jgi:hypothetical protein